MKKKKCFGKVGLVCMTKINWFEFNIDSFLWVFIILNIVNVIIQTIKSLVTIKGTKMSASSVNAIAYGLYVIVVVFMNADGLGLCWKAVITGVANFLGVYIVKFFEEKARKDKLWKIEATIHNAYEESICNDLEKANLKHNYIQNIGKYTIVNILSF